MCLALIGLQTCFVPGMVFLGSNGDPETLAMAAELVKTCYKLYEEQDTGLGPESVAFDRTGKVHRARAGAGGEEH